MISHTIIIVDDDQLVLDSLQLALESLDYTVIPCLDDKQYLRALDGAPADLILLDVHLGAVNGIDLLEKTRELGVTTPVVIITGYAEVPMAVRAMKLGAEDFMLKPVSLEQLEMAVANVLQRASLGREVERLREQVHATFGDKRILGDSMPMRKALALATTYAESDGTTVMLTGESGTGKELFAQFIHDGSPRNAEAFIAVDCGAIPRELAENELFGHERGAFTGATEKLKKGRFELAHHGTIFLDEIGELPLEMQVKLLRVLESRKFYRLGGTRECITDVRVIAATNRDLADDVEQGTFRKDLYYRLNVAAITLPPLRDRSGDIPILVQFYMQDFNKRLRKDIHDITPDAMDTLEQYSWPGNVRELRNVMERVMLVTNDNRITARNLEFVFGSGNEHARGASHAAYHLTIPATGVPIDNVLKDLILQTLRITDGNQQHAAKILGMTRAKFRYRMEQLGIEVKD